MLRLHLVPQKHSKRQQSASLDLAVSSEHPRHAVSQVGMCPGHWPFYSSKIPLLLSGGVPQSQLLYSFQSPNQALTHWRIRQHRCSGQKTPAFFLAWLLWAHKFVYFSSSNSSDSHRIRSFLFPRVSHICLTKHKRLFCSLRWFRGYGLLKVINAHCIVSHALTLSLLNFFKKSLSSEGHVAINLRNTTYGSFGGQKMTYFLAVLIDTQKEAIQNLICMRLMNKSL